MLYDNSLGIYEGCGHPDQSIDALCDKCRAAKYFPITCHICNKCSMKKVTGWYIANFKSYVDVYSYCPDCIQKQKEKAEIARIEIPNIITESKILKKLYDTQVLHYNSPIYYDEEQDDYFIFGHDSMSFRLFSEEVEKFKKYEKEILESRKQLEELLNRMRKLDAKLSKLKSDANWNIKANR